MGEKTNLYIFEKKEVFLIFIFMVLIALTSFMLGVKLGRSYALEEQGISPEDRETIDILSGREEEVETVLGEGRERGSEEIQEEMHRELEERIAEELGETDSETRAQETPPSPEPKAVPSSPSRQGKYTVQLGSYRSRNEAQEFADGFKIKGHEPIIEQVEIQGRGQWFRVSLGVFDSVRNAREYIAKERELFMGQDHIIGRFE